MSRESSHAGSVVPSIEVRLSADRQTATITGGEGHDQMTILTALIAGNILTQTKSAARPRHLLTQFGEAFLGLSEIAINSRIESVQYRLRWTRILNHANSQYEHGETGSRQHARCFYDSDSHYVHSECRASGLPPRPRAIPRAACCAEPDETNGAISSGSKRAPEAGAQRAG